MLFLLFIYNYTPINLNQTTIHIWIVNAKTERIYNLINSSKYEE